MSQPFVRRLLVVGLLLLSACSRDVRVSTVLEDTGGLRPGDKVYLDALEVGSVDSIVAGEQAPGYVIALDLYPEHAELIQSNAVAYVPLKSPPMVVLLNPTEKAEPVDRGARLKGLSPLGAAIWQANDAAAAVSDVMDQFARKVDAYFNSEDWSRTRAQIDEEIAKLADNSRTIAERAVKEIQQLIESLEEDTAHGTQERKDDVTAIQEDIDRLAADGHEKLAASLRRLLEQIEAAVPSDGKPAEAPSH